MALRLLAAGSPGAEVVELSTVGRPMAPGGLIPAGSGQGRGLLEPGCYRHRFDPRVTFPDGSPVAPQDVIAAWESGLRREGGAPGWLLAPVTGSAAFARGAASTIVGLQADGDTLVVCVDRAVPDWAARLSHPELWLAQARAGERGDGPGPFRLAANENALVARTDEPRAAGLARIALVDGRESDAVPLLRTGQIDLAVVYGRAIGEALVPGDGPPLHLARAPGWDKTYALWLDSRSRWLNDPRFRRWLGSVLDPTSALDLVFEGRGSVTGGLLDEDRARPAPGASNRPLARSSRPDLALLVPSDDADAARLAARLEAILDREGVSLVVRAAPPAEYRRDLAAGTFPLCLLVHRPAVDDPILGLLQTVWPLQTQVPDVVALLENGSARIEHSERLDVARRAEGRLLAEARLAPLLRLEAALVRRAGLARVEAGRHGVMRLDAARWDP